MAARPRFDILSNPEPPDADARIRSGDAERTAGDAVDFGAFPGAGHFEPVDPGAAEWQALRSSPGRLLA
jgi:hypothetical protein